MSVLKILIFPDQRLRTIAKEVAVVDEGIKALSKDLLETMYAGNGIGLSATQVNIHKRVLVVDVSEEKNSPIIFINPEIEFLTKEKQTYSEGCLSVPGFFEEVKRPSEIKVKALGIEGEEFTIKAKDILAVAIQHEMDHLDGKIFVDFLSNLKRQRIKQKLMKNSKQ